MKPLDVKSSIYFDFNKENNKEDPKSKVSDHVRKSKEYFSTKLYSKLLWRTLCD